MDAAKAGSRIVLAIVKVDTLVHFTYSDVYQSASRTRALLQDALFTFCEYYNFIRTCSD